MSRAVNAGTLHEGAIRANPRHCDDLGRGVFSGDLGTDCHLDLFEPVACTTQSQAPSGT